MTSLCLLLVIFSQTLSFGTDAAVPTNSENLQKHDIKNQNQSTETSRTAAADSPNKPCRFRWEWESVMYGNICLPAKSSLVKRPKASSIRRHRHRHKNREYDDEPDTLTRHLTLRKGEVGDAPHSGNLLDRDSSVYQMDAPRYVMKSVSINQTYHILDCRVLWDCLEFRALLAKQESL